jgi:hypothetical protein
MESRGKQHHGKKGISGQLKLVSRQGDQGGYKENPGGMSFLTDIKKQPNTPGGAPPDKELNPRGPEQGMHKIEKNVTEGLPSKLARKAPASRCVVIKEMQIRK